MRYLILIQIFTFLSNMAQAQHAAGLDPISFNSQNVHVTLFPPPWQRAFNLQSDSDMDVQQGETDYGTSVQKVDLVPKGQDFTHWTERYGFSSETNMPKSVQEYANEYIKVLDRSCVSLTAEPIVNKPSEMVMTAYCDKYISEPRLGEIAIVFFAKHGDTLVQTHYKMRGSAFQLENVASYPMRPNELTANIALVAQTTVTDAR